MLYPSFRPIRSLQMLITGGGLALLAACTASTPAPPMVAAPPPKLSITGLERVIGKDARALQMLFGAPDLDIRETGARKLQFASPICVLDTYLYPPGAGREPVVTYVDARRPNGDEFDRPSCVAALSRRTEAR
jgi:hypothetical protein